MKGSEMAEITDMTDIQEELELEFKKDIEEKKMRSQKPKSLFICGFTEDGLPFFQVEGEMNFVNLMGLHDYAGRRIKFIVDSAMGHGDAIGLHVAKQLDEILDQSEAIAAARDGKSIVLTDAQGHTKGVKLVS